jgi:hypothetical protein
MSSHRLINIPLKLVDSSYSTMYCTDTQSAFCMSCKCLYCRQPLAPQLNTMLHTASHTFWSLQLMSVITAIWVFPVRSPMVRRQTLHTETLDDSRGKIYSGMRSGYLGGHPICPGILVVIRFVLCAQSIAWEELHSTSLAHRQRNDVVLNPAKVLVEPTPCSFHYISDGSLNNEDICRRPLQFRQISQHLQMSVDVHYSSDRSLNICICLSTSITVPTDLSTSADVCLRPLQFRRVSQHLHMSVGVHYSSDRSLNICRCLSTSITVPMGLSTSSDVCQRPLQFRQISQHLQMSVDVHYSSDGSLNICRCLSTSITVPTDLSKSADICRRPLHFRRISEHLQMSAYVHSSLTKWSQDSVSVYQARHVYACVNLVMSINCDIIIILPPVQTFCWFMCPFK